MKHFALVAASLLVGCAPVSRHDTPAPATSAAESPAPAPAAPETTSARLGAPAEGTRRNFGAAIDTTVPEIPLAEIVADPARYRDTMVRTRGTVVRVCQRMGCWMEMSADGTPAVRVPMGGHAFFLPRDAQGRPTEVQGLVRLLDLSPEARAHLASEGATAVGSALAIDAVAVAID